MAEVLKTPQAETDLLEIWVYVAEDNPEAADKVLEAIDRKCRALADTPGLGRSREDLASSLRSIPERNYVIFYRPIAAGVQIIRVLHGARDVQSLFE